MNLISQSKNLLYYFLGFIIDAADSEHGINYQLIIVIPN